MEVHPLRAHRLSRKLSLSELARRVGTSAATLSRIELGSRTPSLALAAKLKQKTGIPIHKFVREVA